jgi:hypothetical protein
VNSVAWFRGKLTEKGYVETESRTFYSVERAARAKGYSPRHFVRLAEERGVEPLVIGSTHFYTAGMLEKVPAREDRNG